MTGAQTMLIEIAKWLDDHPEQWVPIAGAIAGMVFEWCKQRWPGAARAFEAMAHLVPNLPAAYRALRGRRCKCVESDHEKNP
jgi:hypothetical protein